MVENKMVSDGTNETANQSKELAVRITSEVVGQIEADAAAQNASPTEIVRAIVCKYYAETAGQAAMMREIRDLIEDPFRHIVYEISRTRSSLYNRAEQSGALGLNRQMLKEIQQLSRQDATGYLERLDAEIERRAASATTHHEGQRG